MTCDAADPKPETMTGGRAIVEALVDNGVDTVFGLPGAQLYALFDALALRSDSIRTVSARHEQATAYMAFGAARSTGRPGVYAVVPGPGVLNTTAALSTAYATSTPVLCLTGQVPTPFIGKGRGHLHEIPDQLGVLQRLTKWAARIDRPEDAPAIMDEAFRQMTSGRPGPVAVEMAWDTMANSAPVVRAGRAVGDHPALPDPAAIDAAAKLILSAVHPLILVGSGALEASRPVKMLAERLDAPVTAFRGGRGVVPEGHPLGLSSAAAHALWADTDLVIAIGTRAELPTMRWAGMMAYLDRLPGDRKLVRIDIDPAEMDRLHADAGIVADAAVATAILLRAIERIAPDKPSGTSERRARIAAAKAATAEAIRAVQPQMDYLDAIRRALPDDGFFVPELCQAGFTSYFGFDVRHPRTYVSEGYQGTLGFGFPTALGVKVANPGKAVVSVTGDGGFLFGASELATAVQERIGLVTVLFDNSAYGNVLRDQKTLFGNRVIASALDNPDFAKLADAYGVAYHEVKTADELEMALRTAIAADVPALVHVKVDRESETSPWAFIHYPA